jgi:hypothetical protein
MESPSQYERFGCFTIPCTPGQILQGILSLKTFLALPGVEDEKAYEQVVLGERNSELRYTVNLV